MSKSNEIEDNHSKALKLISQSQKIIDELKEKDDSTRKQASIENWKKEKVHLEKEINSLQTKIHYLEKELKACYFLNETWDSLYHSNKNQRKTYRERYNDRKKHKRGGKKTRKYRIR